MRRDGPLGRIVGKLKASKNDRREKIGNDACLPHVAGANPSTALYTLRQLPVLTPPVTQRYLLNRCP